MCISETELEQKFPYRFLLRWSWPDHIDQALRRVMWAWLNERAVATTDELNPTDYAATELMRLLVASPETPGAVLDVLSKICGESMLVRIAENPSTWASTLMRLAEHSSHLVRIALADNASTPPSIMFRLAIDDHLDVRHAIAENARVDIAILECLTQDANCHIAARATKTLKSLRVGSAVTLPVSKNDTCRKAATA